MTTSSPPTETDLHAYADGLLPPDRHAEIAAWLALNPHKAVEVAQWQRQNEAITTLFGGTAAEPVPLRLSPHRLAAAHRRGLTQTLPRLAAAAIVTLGVGIGLGWVGHGVFNPTPDEDAQLIAGAVAAHDLYVKENRHAVEVAAADSAHLVTWLSNRVARPITLPDLAPDGFSLVGGRLLPASYGPDENRPAAQLMYENANSERITIYITAADEGEKPAYEFSRSGDVEAFYWNNDQITCTVVGSLADADMKAISKKVYQQLTLRPDPQVQGT